MSYNPVIDFLSLSRSGPGGVLAERMPGLDYVVAAMARARLFNLSVGQTPPMANQTTTVWLLPSEPSWVAEGAVFLWNAATSTYQPATPALWSALLVPTAAAVFQTVVRVVKAAGSVTVTTADRIIVINKTTPEPTTVNLPPSPSKGDTYTVKDGAGNAYANAITVFPASGTVDGGSEFVIDVGSGSATFVYNGTQWNVI